MGDLIHARAAAEGQGAMASVKDVKNAFVEDDAVIVPAPAGGSMGPPPPETTEGGRERR